SPSTIRYRGKSSPSRDLHGVVGNAAECTDASDGRFSRVGTIAASAGDCYRNWWDQSAGFRLIPNVLPTRQCLPLNAPCSFFNCPLPSSRMVKKSAAAFSLRSEAQPTEAYLPSSLAAALLNGYFEHSGGCSPRVPDVQAIEVAPWQNSPSAVCRLC